MKIFDAHFHIIDLSYPLIENNGYLPPFFSVDDYKSRTENFVITGGAVVSGSFQGFDHLYLLEALKKLGGNFYGVANIHPDIKKEKLKKLDEAGVTAVRFNLKRNGSEILNHMVSLSNRLFDEFGWHTELYVDSTGLSDINNKLSQLPTFSIDHLGLSKDGLVELYRWVEKGVKVKATGFGRVDFDPVSVMQKIYSINPDALIFGTDLPSTRAKVPFSDRDLKLIQNNFSEEAQRKILFENAFEWYTKNN